MNDLPDDHAVPDQLNIKPLLKSVVVATHHLYATQINIMPEGPSIIILKELLEPLHLVGKEVIAVSGNTSIDIERMLHQQVKAIKSWGKHFLICFDGFTLRVHFMMFGSYRINERKGTAERLRLEFIDAEFNLYTCSLTYIEGDINKTYDWSADVLSDQWNPKAALKKLGLKPDVLVCDALLDQEIFSGVGNIIKNEVLYRIRVHPLSQIGKLPPAKLKILIAEARIYSFDFLNWKKEFTLKKHWLAYRQKICLRCNLPFHKEYLGRGKRQTFYCSNCQKLYTALKTGPQTIKKSLPI
ncbi:DNA-formamidopyrimidine glycosylase family protein [Pedobacter sp. L105]|uniref:DNA-formamidopyrimidine glycosylase family protein n=1 Tax=Pedobacter sp. L105 TaxID=1641871 RepID=UPI0020B12FED|nr:DNA-formamidopyrimidine glycosylase family protein [Pedobacter sp. L105]